MQDCLRRTEADGNIDSAMSRVSRRCITDRQTLTKLLALHIRFPRTNREIRSSSYLSSLRMLFSHVVFQLLVVHCLPFAILTVLQSPVRAPSGANKSPSGIIFHGKKRARRFDSHRSHHAEASSSARWHKSLHCDNRIVKRTNPARREVGQTNELRTN